MSYENLVSYHESGDISLHSPVAMPNSSAFLWNSKMMIQVSCGGFATAQFIQPEPAKYAHAPNLEMKTFMQPEQNYYAHHPGRFFYVRESSAIYSLPYEPVRAKADRFSFTASPSKISWFVRRADLSFELSLSLHPDRPLELWDLAISNQGSDHFSLDVFPYFPFGYMSWMNQSASYDSELSAIIAKSITPYQKVEDYFRHREFKDLSLFLAEQAPQTWDARQSAFEGEGGLAAPAGVMRGCLSSSVSDYETPTAAMHYNVELPPTGTRTLRFAFGAAKSRDEIADIRSEVFGQINDFAQLKSDYAGYVRRGELPLALKSPDTEFDLFVNHWLGRQIFYHGDVNRLTTDPQTRNFLQDHMGMSYVEPDKARDSFLLALSQQRADGAMPDGILLHDGAQLKYINQVPHMDHCLWLPIALSAYLDETGDYGLLDKDVASSDQLDNVSSVCLRVSKALNWLFGQQDDRGLNYIAQGDWNDPMNMVGYKGQGVSVWLTLATAYACQVWARVCDEYGDHEQQQHFLKLANSCNEAVNRHAWFGDRYARGITDAGRFFGIPSDTEGKLFLNPQAWAMLSGAADQARQEILLKSIQENLETPYGTQMLAPAYTQMQEDIGRITQKFPGSAENGSIYNHAAAFYVYALFQNGHADHAFQILRQMIPGPDSADLLQRGQLPVFVPNYYRGAVQQFPRTAGRSSQLFNTGTVHWMLRSLLEGLIGLKGCKEGLLIEPQLPSDWPSFSVTRKFRGNTIHMSVERDQTISEAQIFVDGKAQEQALIPMSESDCNANRNYVVKVLMT